VADSLVLTGLARRSGEAYAREIRILVRRYQRPPFTLTEADVRRFMLERHKKLNGSSQRILYRGLRFLYNDLFKCDWELLKAASAKHELIEPAILSREEIGRLFASIRTPHIYAYLRTVYSCGLRLSEALHIRPGDIDRAAGLLHVRQGVRRPRRDQGRSPAVSFDAAGAMLVSPARSAGPPRAPATCPPPPALYLTRQAGREERDGSPAT